MHPTGCQNLSTYAVRVRIVMAPDSFTGTLTSAQAARSMADGWSRSAPLDAIDLVPMSDGGPGFVDALSLALADSRVVDVQVAGPLGTPVDARILLAARTPDGYDGTTAFIESALACGLHLVPEDRRDPTVTTSQGVGELLTYALDHGATRIVVGVGGTGSCDGGSGLLSALDVDVDAASIDLAGARSLLDRVELLVATDVDVPLLGPRGAAHGFAPQKGATAQQVEELESRLDDFAQRVGRTPQGRSPAVSLGAGAGGGIGFALIALGAQRIAGIETVAHLVGLRQRLADADLVVTGEGSFDWQSLRGKVVAGVAQAALEHALPVLVIAGRVEVGRREYVGIGVTSVYSLSEFAGSPQAAMEDAEHWAAVAAETAARTYSR